MDPLDILTKLAVLLIFGILGSALAKKTKISNVLVLLLIGLFIGKITDYFQFEGLFLVSVAIITLALVIFEGTSKLSYRQIDIYSGLSTRLTLFFMLFSILFVGMAAYFIIFNSFQSGLILSLILAVAIAGTDPSSILIMIKNSPAKIAQILTLEAIINTPLMVIIPFILIDTIDKAFSFVQLFDIVQQIIVGIGTGVVLSLIIFKSLRKFYSNDLSPIAIIAAALLSYIIAENLDGSGVLSVATLGILFGNFTIKRKDELKSFSFAFSNILEILIFLLIGILLGGQIEITWNFIVVSFEIFFVLIIARLLAAIIAFRKQHTWKEIMFFTLTMPKGIAMAVLIFTFALIPQIPTILLSMLFAVIIYSVLLATLATRWIDITPPPEPVVESKKSPARHKRATKRKK